MATHVSTPPSPLAGIDWRPTTAQKIGAAVGLLLGVGGALGDVPWISGVLFVPGYAAACAVIPRFRGVAKYGHVDWFAAHEFGMGAIVLGWVLAEQWGAAAFNASWLVSAGVWYARARRGGHAEQSST